MGTAKSTLLRLCAALILTGCFFAHGQTVTTFEGIDASQLAKPNLDIDPNGAVGTKQYFEWTNVYYQAFDKVTFAPVWSKPQAGATPWVTNGNANCQNITGDGVVNFDRLASRWIIAAHNAGSTSYYYCVAISSTDDLSSSKLSWFTYAIPLNSLLGTNAQGTTYFPDWPKLATWSDAYYVSMDLQDPNAGYEEVGVVVCALDRANMLIGATANVPQCFRNPAGSSTTLYLAHSLQPADVDSTTAPPAGSPEYFVSIENPVNDGVTTTSDTFNLWQFHVDWSNPANSSFTQSTVPVAAFTPGCYIAKFPTNTVCVPEPSTATTNQFIDSVGDRFMYRFAYHNFGTYQSYLVSHAVQTGAGSLSQTGIRWYELRGSGVPTVFQSGTVSPDQSLYRFMPSIAQDQNGNAAVGYSVSSASTHPGISASWWSLTDQTSPTELTLFAGAGDEENSYHWGDYTSMTVDPVGGCSFWYVNEYFAADQTGTGKPIWKTRVSTFNAPGCGGVSVAPTSLTFPSQAVGTTSAKQNVILTNSQSTALTINSIFGGGANPSDFGQSNNCGTSVPAGASCTIGIDFAPTATGTRTATLTVSDSATNSPQVVTLTGTGTNSPTISLSTSSINFGNVAYGTTSPAQHITVTNNGGTTVTFSGIAVTGTNSANFAEINNCGTSLNAGATCSISVNFSPTAASGYSAAVTLTDNAANSPQSVTLAGAGIAPVSLSASSVGFGTVLVGSSSTAPAVTLKNQMSTALTGISISVTGSGYSQVNTCGTSVAAGATCTITVKLTPITTGALTGTVTITDSAVSSPQTITLTGTGQLPVSFTPVALTYGTVTVGTTSAAKSVVVSNNQKTTLSITSIVLGGPNTGDFAPTSSTCGATLAAAAKCTLSYTFKPTATGARSAKLTFTDSATTSPQTVKLSGTGQAAAALRTVR
ncbi:MAG TPA: choice-of-anchor D domain-containing protein [Candidatus Sulfotelmatobacter sp.]